MKYLEVPRSKYVYLFYCYLLGRVNVDLLMKGRVRGDYELVLLLQPLHGRLQQEKC